MNIYFVCLSNFYNNNRIFDINSKYNRDNAFHPFYTFKEQAKAKGIEVNTADLCLSNKEENILIFVDLHRNYKKIIKKYNAINSSYLIIFESSPIRSINWETQNHKYFKKIFTWNDSFIDNKKFFKINWTHKIPLSIPKNLEKKEKLCTLIAGNKKVSHPLELYSKRIESIRWFEKYHANEFDLYGIGWDEFRTKNKYFNFLLSKNRWMSKPFAKNYPSYKGKIIDKKSILEKYKFSICYENVKNTPGYITEKIFDCFFAGCIPIYWGAPNILDHIPEECFIDKRKFASYESLYDFITTMTDETYLSYLNNIKNFLTRCLWLKCYRTNKSIQTVKFYQS
jgi:alpha(1,3/1,4) fucosyltransferase